MSECEVDRRGLDERFEEDERLIKEGIDIDARLNAKDNDSEYDSDDSISKIE